MKDKTGLFIMIITAILFLITMEIILRMINYGPQEYIPDKEILFNEGVFHQKSENPLLVYEIKPNVTKKGPGKVIYTSNFNGLRDYVYNFEKSNNTIRIAALGDSIVFGYGIDLEDTFLKILERKLNSMGDNIKYEIINFGVGGYNIIQELETFKTKVLNYTPDIILIGYTLNDPAEANNPSDQIQLSEQKECYINFLNIKINCYFKNFFKKFKTALFIKDKIRNIILRLKIDKEADLILHNFRQYYINKEKWVNVQKSFEEISKITKNNNQIVYVIIFPILKDFKNYLLEDIHKMIIEEVQKNEFYVTDLLEEYSKYNEEILQISRTDILHPNRYGHKIAAEIAYEKLINEIII